MFGTQQPAVLPYKIYEAFLQFEDTAPETVTSFELQNTLGGTVVWTRVSNGSYLGTLAGAFPSVDKTVIPPFGNWLGNATVFHTIHDGAATTKGRYTMYWNNANSVALFSINNAGTSTNMGILIGGSVKTTLVEIRVYP